MSNETKRFILLGEAGAGKSTLINVLYNYFYGSINPADIFCEDTKIKIAIPCKYWEDRIDNSFANQKGNERDINDITISQTITCCSYLLENANHCYEIIDTPGFNDTAGIEFDGNNLNHIEEKLRGVPYMNGIIVVINGSIDRVSVAFKNFLHLLRQVWSDTLLNTCIGVLTNCDSSSVNIHPRLLSAELRINPEKTFYFQNNVFRWNRQRKVTKQLQEDFKETIESVKRFLSVLKKSPSVSTESFLVSPIKLGLIQTCIETSIEHLLDLVTATANIQLAEDGISGSKLEMTRNTNRDFHHRIHAVAWEAMLVTSKKKSKDKTESQTHYDEHMVGGDTSMQECSSFFENPSRLPAAHAVRNEKLNKSDNLRHDHHESQVIYRPKNTVVELVVPDGESIARYSIAQQEHDTLLAKKNRLYDKRQELEISIKNAYETLQQQVSEIQKINMNYDLLGKNSAILQQFRRKTAAISGNHSFLNNHYQKIIEILSAK